ncbi:hypothetical protein AAZX31_14G108800 [Glycine max]
MPIKPDLKFLLWCAVAERGMDSGSRWFCRVHSNHVYCSFPSLLAPVVCSASHYCLSSTPYRCNLLFKLLEILCNFNPSKLTLSNRSKISIRSPESSDKEIHACETNPKRNTNKIHREYGSGRATLRKQ